MVVTMEAISPEVKSEAKFPKIYEGSRFQETANRKIARAIAHRVRTITMTRSKIFSFISTPSHIDDDKTGRARTLTMR